MAHPKTAPATPLAEYERKRDFSLTAEPKGRKAKSARKLAYVIQKHAATRLHYDLRLELDGVMKSWAVPRGPSLDPAQKRLAVEVEDHPVDYNSFEGIIPAGEYGGGTVMIWDRGSWSGVKGKNTGGLDDLRRGLEKATRSLRHRCRRRHDEVQHLGRERADHEGNCRQRVNLTPTPILARSAPQR